MRKSKFIANPDSACRRMSHLPLQRALAQTLQLRHRMTYPLICLLACSLDGFRQVDSTLR
jgi:hypothetical protein